MIRCSSCGHVEPSESTHDYSYAGNIKTLTYCILRGQAAIGEPVTDDPRMNRDELFMRTALLFAQRSTCTRGHVGAVVVRDRRILVTAYNGAPPGALHCLEAGCVVPEGGGCQRAVHAEANAIAWAAREGIPLKDSHLYCTHEPCLPCAKLIVTAGIVAVDFNEPYRVHDGLDLLTQMDVPVRRLLVDA